MTAISLFIMLGFILSLVFHIISAILGMAIGLAIVAIIIWFVVEIFLIPGMLRRDRQQIEKEVLREMAARRGGEV